MSNVTTLDVNDREVLKMFSELSTKSQRQAHRKALAMSLNVVKREAVRRLKREVRVGKGKKSMDKGIKMKVSKEGHVGKIHIMGDYRLKWFEMGTEDRHFRLPKGTGKRIRLGRVRKYRVSKYVGKIGKKHFFKKAMDAKQNEASRLLNSNISKSIMRINDKYRSR